MSEPDTGSFLNDHSTDEWDAFLARSRRYYEAENFDQQEQDNKLVIAERLPEARVAFEAHDDDWPTRRKSAFAAPNNLTAWQVSAKFTDWCRDTPGNAARVLQQIWHTTLPIEARFSEFIASVPLNAAKVSIRRRLSSIWPLMPSSIPCFAPHL